MVFLLMCLTGAKSWSRAPAASVSVGQTRVLVPACPEPRQQMHLVNDCVVHSVMPGIQLQLDRVKNKARLDLANEGFEITAFDLL